MATMVRRLSCPGVPRTDARVSRHPLRRHHGHDTLRERFRQALSRRFLHAAHQRRLLGSSTDAQSALSEIDQLWPQTTSIIQAGEFVGALTAGPVGDYGGRRLGFLVATALVVLGATLQIIVTGSVPLLTVGRFVLGCGVGVISNVVPLYLSEISPTGALRSDSAASDPG